jgi:voltage-gated potassium channel Kch
MATPKTSHRKYFRIAWQSALAAALCLGLPAGLSLWLVLVRSAGYALVLEPLNIVLRDHGLYRIYLVVLTSILWSYLLGRISGFRPWWQIAVASALGILVAWFSPLANVDGILYQYRPTLPVHLSYASSMVGLIGGVTLFVGLAYGLILRDIKASITIGSTTSFVSIRVGTGNLAMVKVTAVNLLTSALAGGTALGVGFSWFVAKEKHDLTVQVQET